MAPGFKTGWGGGSRAGEGARCVALFEGERSGLCSGQLWPDQSKKTDKNPERKKK